MIGLQTDLRRQRSDKALPMIGNNNVPFVRIAFLVHLLMWWNTAANDLDAAAISKKAENRAVAATVRIYVKEYSWQDYTFSGSGFFVKPHLIATNFHVIVDKDNSRVMPYIAYRHSKRDRFHTVKPVKVKDVKRDLAVLEVSRSRIKPLILGGSESVERLDKVYVVGFAKALDCGITSGEINNPKERFSGVEYIRFDAPVSPGNSGGPVVDLHGDVIGVATAVYKSRIHIKPKDIGVSVPQNLNFAIPSNRLRSLLNSHGVPVPPKPKRKRVNRDLERKNEEKAKAEAEKARAEAKKAEAEAKKAEADARRVEAERAKAEAEKAKTEKPKAVEPKPRITDQLNAATVRIFGRDSNGKESLLGCGFFVRPNQVATDSSVIEGSTRIRLEPIGERSPSAYMRFSAQVVDTDEKHSLAILWVYEANVVPPRIGNSDKIGVGEPIQFVRNPFEPASSNGTISALQDRKGIQFFQFVPSVRPGTSGGPVVNNEGEVIAVVALKVPELGPNLDFAIPSKYLIDFLEILGEVKQPKPDADSPPPTTIPEVSVKPEVFPNPNLKVTAESEDLLKPGIEFYKSAQFREAVEALQSVLKRLDKPKERARAHLYLGFSKWGLADTKSSVSAEFREALRYNPSVTLPDDVGQDHPVFKPLLEKARQESTGILTITASPPETEIKIYGGEVQPKLPDDRTEPIRLFKGNYAVEGILDGAHKVMPVLIEPGDRRGITLRMQKTPVPEHEFELTLDLYSAEKPKEVVVHYTIYSAGGKPLDQDKKEMQLREEKPESSIWVYHVKLPVATQGGKIVYRIETDGEVIPGRPMEVEILEPPANALIDINQSIPIKARVISNVEVSEVRVVYDAPTTLADTSLSQKLEKESSSNTYKGKIPARRNHSDGTTWYYVTATNKSGENAISATRAVRAKRLSQDPPEITVLAPRGSAVLPINKAINIEAEVESNAPLKEVRVYYNSKRKGLSEASPSAILENKSSDTYIGKIPKEHSREEGYIWYFVLATTQNGMKSEPIDRVVEIKELETRIHQGVWASHSWSSYVQNNLLLNSDWARGDVVSLAYLSEGKGFQTIGARLDFPYENSANTNAAIEWGPALKDSYIAFAILAGVAGYRSSNANFPGTRQSTEITPLLGGSLKFYPLDRATIDLTGSIKLRSANGAGSRETDFTRTHLHHYEMGIRLYISPSLNLKAGYGKWRLGEYHNTSVQIGLGVTF